jgi:hypothetical protein
MKCEYYIQSELVVKYVDKYSVMHKTITNTTIQKKYISNVPENDSNDDFEIRIDKYNKEIKKCIEKNIYNKMLYENDTWVKELYKKRYAKQISFLCPNLHKILTIYKKYSAWV